MQRAECLTINIRKNIVTHNGKRMTTEDANVQHYQDQVRQAYADHAEKSKKGRDPL